MDELHIKQKKQKIEYGKILSQLEDSEMSRIKIKEKNKHLFDKVYRLKKQLREQQISI